MKKRHSLQVVKNHLKIIMLKMQCSLKTKKMVKKMMRTLLTRKLNIGSLDVAAKRRLSSIQI
jgi:hypothetical protein